MGNHQSNDLGDLINKSNNDIKNSFNDSLDKTKNAFNDSLANTKQVTDGLNNDIKNGFNNTFSQDNMNKFDDQLVGGLKDTGRVMGKIGDVADKVLNSPLMAPLSAVPLLGEAISGLKVLNTGIKAGGALSSGLGDIADRNNYDGKDGATVAGNVLEKSINTGENVANTGITFH